MGSYPYGVFPSLEQQWREEVLYLHSLWHKGPPRNPNPKPISNNIGSSNSTTPKPNSNNLGASNSTTFKKRKLRVAKKDTKPIVSEVEWPCGPDPEPRQETGWPQLKPHSDQVTRPATSEEQAKFTALQLQQKGLKACQDFFSSKVCSDDEEEEELMDDDVDESEESKFFLGIFTDDSDLRSYYEKNWESGEFCCLVCVGTGKVGKRFKNCVALVQHSSAISKTKKRAAHRAFGKTICRVLGWEIHRLPSIVLSLGEPLGRSLAKAESEVCIKENSAQKEDLHENFVDLVDDDDDDDDDDEEELDSEDHSVGIQKEDLNVNFVDLVDDDDDDDDDDDVDVELDPEDHGVGIQKEDFQSKFVDSAIVKDEQMDIQAGSKNGELHQKDLTSETV